MTSALRPHFTKLLGLAFLFISVSLHAAPPKEALLIANGKYSHFAGLAHPEPDAAKLSAALEQLGFRIRVVRDGNREILQDAGKVSAEIAQAHAESEFEKYRIIQDHLFESDFDRMIKQLPNSGEQP